MNVKQEQINDYAIRVDVQVEKADYEAGVKKALADYRRRADIKGFRKGMAPMSMIQKLYGASAKIEEINKLVSEGLNNYMQEQDIRHIGEPMPSDEQAKNDFDNGEVLNFAFDVMLAPRFELTLDQSLCLPYYRVETTEEMAQEFESRLFRQYGSLENGASVEAEDYVTFDLSQADRKVDASFLNLRDLSAQNQELLLGKQVGDVLDLNVNELFEEAKERARFLKMKEEDLEGLDPQFKALVNKIERFVNASPGEEFYNKAFGEGVVKTEEEFHAKAKEMMAAEYARESDAQFQTTIRESLLAQANIHIDDERMKRWLFDANENKITMEEVEKEYPAFLADFAWQTVCNYVAKAGELQVTKEEVEDYARQYAAYQFMMYGMTNLDPQQVNGYAQNLMADERQRNRFYEAVEQTKVYEYVKSHISKDVQTVSLETLRNMKKAE